MKFGEYHPGDIFEYPPVLAGENSVTRCVETNRVRAKIFDGLIYMIMLLFSKQKKNDDYDDDDDREYCVYYLSNILHRG